MSLPALFIPVSRTKPRSPVVKSCLKLNTVLFKAGRFSDASLQFAHKRNAARRAFLCASLRRRNAAECQDINTGCVGELTTITRWAYITKQQHGNTQHTLHEQCSGGDVTAHYFVQV